jgi:hypothetical protein
MDSIVLIVYIIFSLFIIFVLVFFELFFRLFVAVRILGGRIPFGVASQLLFEAFGPPFLYS